VADTGYFQQRLGLVQRRYEIDPAFKPVRTLSFGRATPAKLGMIGIGVGRSKQVDDVLGQIRRP
jgi:hypothetical protein